LRRIGSATDFWDSYAARYNGFVGKSLGKAYEILFEEVLADTKNTKKLLEIGTGPGLIAFRLGCKIPEITAIDLSPEMIKVAKKKQAEKPADNINFRVGNACCLEFDDSSFDTIIASNILHLLAEPERALKEMKRVLKKEGHVIFPTYCHGDSLKSSILSRLIGLSGLPVRNRWSTHSLRNFVEQNEFKVTKSKKIEGMIPLFYLTAIGV